MVNSTMYCCEAGIFTYLQQDIGIRRGCSILASLLSAYLITSTLAEVVPTRFLATTSYLSDVWCGT